MNSQYSPVSVKIKEPAILIRINKKFRDGISQQELFEITRGVWKVGKRRESTKFAFAVFKGIVKEVYEIHSWHPAGTLPYSTRLGINIPGRWEFEGNLASEEIRNQYIDLSVEEYFPGHAQNPITYVNC